MTENETIHELPEKKRRKVLFGCLLAALLTIVACLVIVTILLYSCFDHEPLEEVARIPDTRHLESLMNKFYISSESKDSDKALQIMGLLMQQSMTLELSGEEVNALLEYSVIASRPYLATRLPNFKLSDARFKDGTLQAEGSYDTETKTPFGKYLNIKIRLVPKIKDEKFIAEVRHLSVGSGVVSGRSLQNSINRKLDTFAKSQTGEEILEVIQELDIKDDTLTITFNPRQMTMFLSKKLKYASDINITE
ncbi:MAG: hypothetical protein JW808_02255 [Victivallales bacterium]|nr:hypothetical protein [Victivallales bacterium]